VGLSLLCAALVSASSACESSAGGSTGAADVLQGGASDATADGAGTSDAASDVASGVETVGSDATSEPDVPVGPDTPASDALVLTSCVALGDCVATACNAAKGAAGCEQECFAAAPADVKAKAKPVWDCISGTCMAGPCASAADPAKCMDDCIGQKCSSLLFACVDGSMSGSAGCGDAIGCLDGCKLASGTPFACWQGCIDALSPGALPDLGKLATCMNKSTDPNPGALGAAEMIQCVTAGKTGTGGCGDIFTCAQKCGSDDPKCFGPCAALATKEAQTAFIEAATCMGGQQSSPECNTKLLQCLASGKTGSQACYQVLACSTACPKDELGCMGTCIQAGTQAAQGAYMGLLQCFGKAMTQQCADEFMACAVPSGTKPCSDVVPCTQACQAKLPPGTDPGVTCVLECVHELSPEAAKVFGAFFSCQSTCEAACGSDETCKNACGGQTCKSQYDACFPSA